MKLVLKILGAVAIIAAGAGAYFWYSQIERPMTYSTDGIYEETEELKDVVIKASNVTLANKKITGSLTIQTDGGHDLYLENLEVQGDIIVKSPKEGYAIYLDDVNARKLKIASEYPMEVILDGNTSIKDAEVNQDIRILENISPGYEGIRALTVFEKQNAQVMLEHTGLDLLVLDTSANVLMDEASMAENVIVNQPSTLVNQGDIGLLNANANVSYLKKPKKIASGDKVEVKDSTEVTTKATKATTTTSVTITTSGRRNSANAGTTKPAATTTKKTTQTTKSSASNTTATAKPVNTPPVITAEDIKIMVGAKLNPLQGVSVTDAEDGRGKITAEHIVSNDVDTAHAGFYTIIYRYTDKGGLTATLTRTVTVTQDEKKMVAPRNLSFQYDNEGGLQFSWEYVTGAYDYNVYVNGALVETGVKRNYTYVEKYIDTSKENELAVVAYASPATNLQPSVPATIKYKAEPGYINMPTVVYADTTKATNIFFRFHDLFVNTRPINKVQIKVERYVNRTYQPVSDLKIAYNKRTDDDGIAMIYDYARSGMSLEASFKQQGSYRMTFTLQGSEGKTQVMEHKFDVLNYDGSMEAVFNEPVVSDFYVTYYDGSSYARIDWDAYLVFYLPNDLNTRYPEDDISVTFYYHTSEVSEGKIITFDAADLRLSRKEISANEIIRVILSKGDSASFEDFMKENYEKAVSISAKITIKDGNKEFSTTTRKIRLS